MTTHRNVASPEQSTEAMAEWATEDLMAAEPYPMPEITEEMVKDFHRQDDGAYGQRGKHFAGGGPQVHRMAGPRRMPRSSPAIPIRRPLTSMRCSSPTRPTLIARSASCSLNRAAGVGLRRQPQSARMGCGPPVTAFIRAMASQAAGRRIWSLCRDIRTVPRLLDSSLRGSCGAGPTGISMAIRVVSLKIWVRQL